MFLLSLGTLMHISASGTHEGQQALGGLLPPINPSFIWKERELGVISRAWNHTARRGLFPSYGAYVEEKEGLTA